jgi:hypothetical protein
MVLMAFDDDQEEVIEFIDTSFFNFLTIIIMFMLYRYSVHYFSFLVASASEGKTVSYLGQAAKDTINSVSIALRFYLLAIRINIYDFLDDVLDSNIIIIVKKLKNEVSINLITSS